MESYVITTMQKVFSGMDVSTIVSSVLALLVGGYLIVTNTVKFLSFIGMINKREPTAPIEHRAQHGMTNNSEIDTTIKIILDKVTMLERSGSSKEVLSSLNYQMSMIVEALSSLRTDLINKFDVARETSLEVQRNVEQVSMKIATMERLLEASTEESRDEFRSTMRDLRMTLNEIMKDLATLQGSILARSNSSRS